MNFRRYFFFLLLFSFNFLNADAALIGEIDFMGNFLVNDQDLRKIITSVPGGVFDQQTLNSDAETISKYYRKKGIYNTKVFQPEIFPKNPQQIDVTFRIEENEQIIIDSVRLSGNRYISQKKIFEDIHLKTETELKEIPQIMKDIIDYYTRNSFLFAEITLDSLKYAEGHNILFLTISEGAPCKFEEYRFKGNKTTKNRTLLKIARLEDMEKPDPLILERAAENIRRKAYIKDCSLIPLDSRKLLFSIQEDKMTFFSGIVGYDNSQTDNDKFTGFLNMDFLNLFGTDRSISVYWQKYQRDRNSLEMKYHESGPNSFPISGDISFYRETIDSTYIRTTVNSEIYYYDLINKYGIYLGWDDIFPGNRRPILIEKQTFHKYGIFWKYDRRDYYLNPAGGSGLSIKYYYKYNFQDGKKIHKQAVETDFEKYIPVGKNLVIALKTDINIIENKSINEFDFFYSGGNSNLRGFNENQFYGYRTACFNGEFRYLFSRNSRTFVFFDYGYVENPEYRYGLLFGTGFGLRLETRLGILGIDYGIGYLDGRFRNPLNGIIHFALEAKI